MEIKVAGTESHSVFIQRDMTIILDVDGTERSVRMWNDEDGNVEEEWGDDQSWYDALTEDDRTDVDEAVSDAFHLD